MSDPTTIARNEPEPFIVVHGPRSWRGLKEDLHPFLALLGAIYGWVFALLVALIAAVILLLR